MAYYLDDSGRVRDEDTGRFAPMEAYLNQLAEEAYAEEEAFEPFGGEAADWEEVDVDFEIDLDDYPDEWLDAGDEVELTVDVAYEEGET